MGLFAIYNMLLVSQILSCISFIDRIVSSEKWLNATELDLNAIDILSSLSFHMRYLAPEEGWLVFSCLSPDHGENKVSFVVPSFKTGSSASSRGIGIGEIVDNPNDISLFSKRIKILQTFPFIPSLKRVDINVDAENPLKNAGLDNFESFNFSFKLNENSKVNEDGIFLRIDYADKARIEYYYNSNTGRFTYRQFSLCTFDGEGYGFLNMILVLELTDIPVVINDDGTVSYTAGNLAGEQMINEKNCTMDYITLSSGGMIGAGITRENSSSIWRDYRLINSDNNILAAFSLPWWSEHYDFEIGSGNFSSVCEKYGLDNLYDLSSQDTYSDLGMDFMFEIINAVYVTQHEESA